MVGSDVEDGREGLREMLRPPGDVGVITSKVKLWQATATRHVCICDSKGKGYI